MLYDAGPSDDDDYSSSRLLSLHVLEFRITEKKEENVGFVGLSTMTI